MATLIELWKSREGTFGESADWHFLVKDAADQVDLDAAIEDAKTLGTIPATTEDGLVYQTYHRTPRGKGVWEVQCMYGKLTRKSVGDFSYQFTTGGKTIKRKVSLATIASYPTAASGDIDNASDTNPVEITTTASHGLVTGQKVNIAGMDVGDFEGLNAINSQWPVTVTGLDTFTIPLDGSGFGAPLEGGTWARPAAPDLGGCINVSENGVEGVEIPGPGFEWNETHVIPNGSVGVTYITAIANMNGMVNAAPFRGFAAGEVRFMYITGGRRNNEDSEYTFYFEREANKTNIEIAPGLTIAAKEGMQYAHILFEEQKSDTGLAKKVPKAQAAYVERVSDYANFAVLGIGTESIW